ncbi:FtsB family cell division protein [Bifidobacterium leontopitheci]|nr:septum formation initiator family protein [Bifidobacterium leontopitheci]
MSTSTRTKNNRSAKRGHRNTGPIVFFVSVIILIVGAMQLVATFHTYALNLAQLNDLKKQEAELVQQKQDLENDIERWNDDSYVAAQARKRLGFVFPGEKAVRVLHPEAVTGQQDDSASGTSDTSDKVLPWYSELAYAFRKADERPATSSNNTSSNGTTSSGKTSSGKTSSGKTSSDQADTSTSTGDAGTTKQQTTTKEQ